MAEHDLLGSELHDDRALALRELAVSRETTAVLDRLVALLVPAALKANLIGRSTIPTVWTRHIADSLQLIPLASQAKTWVDLGSGAGFPGLVIACALAGTQGAEVHLVESIGKKAAFLREAARALDLPAQVHHVRIEDFVKNFKQKPDVVCARALAPLDKLLHLAAPLLKTGVLGMFPKGQDVDAELTQASKYWSIEADLIPSKTSEEGRIVVVHRVAPRHPMM